MPASPIRASHPSAPEQIPETPLLRARGVTHFYGRNLGCRDVSFDLYEGEVLAVIGESGSGKTTLLNCLATHLAPSAGSVEYRTRDGALRDVFALAESERSLLAQSDWGFIHQNPVDGIRMTMSAGGNVGERLLALGARRYDEVRRQATAWLGRVEIDPARIDDRPGGFSGGMRQRLQIARNLVTRPRLILMDEPTGGLDVSVQAQLLDLIRRLVRDLGVAIVFVTHDLAVARLLSQRLMVMRRGEVVEYGLTDRVLDDPHAPYTQLLVSSVLQG